MVLERGRSEFVNYINCDKCKYKDKNIGCNAKKCYSPSNIFYGAYNKIHLLLNAMIKRTPCNHPTSKCSFRAMKKYCSLCKGGCDNR